MNTPTKELADYLEIRGITIAAIIKGTGLPREAMYKSLGKNATRELRSSEFLEVCSFAEVDPMKFLPKRKNDGE